MIGHGQHLELLFTMREVILHFDQKWIRDRTDDALFLSWTKIACGSLLSLPTGTSFAISEPGITAHAQ